MSKEYEYQRVFGSTAAALNHTLRERNGKTGSMTTAEIAEYLASQREKGWPLSQSIHPYGRRSK